MYMYVAVAPHASWPQQKMSRVKLNFLQCAVRIFNTVQMQLWQSSTFSNYPLNIHISHVHVCSGCPSCLMAQQKNVKG